MSHILKENICETFLERVKETPDCVAFRFKDGKNNPLWKEITFKDFYEKVVRLSYFLKKNLIVPSTHIGIYSRTRFEWVLTDIAILSMRSITVPIHSTSTTTDLEFLLSHSDCEMLFIEHDEQIEEILKIKDKLPKLKHLVIFDSNYSTAEINSVKITSLNHALSFSPENDAFFYSSIKEIKLDDYFTLAYTSGSTGDPKGVLLSHKNLQSVIEDCAELFGKFIKDPKKSEGEDLLTFLPLSHIIGKLEVMMMFVFGWRINFVESVQKLDEHFMEVKPTILFAVPKIFDRAYEKINEALHKSTWKEKKAFSAGLYTSRKLNQIILSKEIIPSWIKISVPYFRKFILRRVHDAFGGKLRFVICGGAPLSKNKAEYFSALGIHIFEGYGLTETCAPITLNTFSHTQFGSVGKPLPEVKIRIEEDGEILVQSKKVFHSYYKNEAATKDVFKEDWFHTGDVGFIDPKGYLHITDRKKDLIILSGGKNIAPQKLEQELKLLTPLIEDVIVIGDSEKNIAALITLSTENLTSFLEEKEILFSDLQQIHKHPKILNEIQTAVDCLNRTHSKPEKIKHFLVLSEPFTQKKGELSVSMKVRRTRIISKYHNEIKALFSSD